MRQHTDTDTDTEPDDMAPAQSRLNAMVLRRAANPEDDIDKIICVPGLFWGAKHDDGKFYKCKVCDYDKAHQFKRIKGPGYMLVELDTEEEFWMKTPTPYLNYRNNDETKLVSPALFEDVNEMLTPPSQDSMTVQSPNSDSIAQHVGPMTPDAQPAAAAPRWLPGGAEVPPGSDH